ncbi:MAG: tRNA 2-thiouridine(34) synthase MnmA [Candidatus Dojkabacteria bacterium]|nr:MAG: tRNA 2-thiouridine(34) synthase MnmA [Candidatus Dojkabacteria bacterium]
MKSSQKPTIYVALSGGVDSAVAAALLVHAGYPVVGVYMKNWADNFGVSARCPWEEEVADVEKVATHLGIPWKVYNFEKEYKARVLDYFFSEYKAGRTPNPDIFCNNLIKFDSFAQRAREEGAAYIATGHYARRRSMSEFPWEASGTLGLFTALDATKDQGYFLQRISAEQLQRATFPLGNYYKKEVRILAQHFGLPNATKKDSQGICFVGDIDVRDFIREHLDTNPGDIVDIQSGDVVGRHQGLWFYTIGQRQGIGVSSTDAPYFVVKKEPSSNQLYIAQGHDNAHLLKENIAVAQLHSISEQFYEGQEVMVALRYRERPYRATITNFVNDRAMVVSQDSRMFWAPAEGQGVMICEGEKEDKYAEKTQVSSSASDLYKYFTGNETRTEIREVEILGGGIVS